MSAVIKILTILLANCGSRAEINKEDMMIKRFFIGLTIGCILSVLINLGFYIAGFHIESPIPFFTGMGCAAVSIGVALIKKETKK